jgi:DNA-directed RNA polymerase beta subunit
MSVHLCGSHQFCFRVCAVTPHQCRLGDLTYAGRITVDVRYVMDRRIVTAKGVEIGLMPLMLRSSNCVLTGKSLAELAKASRLQVARAVALRGFLWTRVALHVS